jgi:hypothetical protein
MSLDPICILYCNQCNIMYEYNICWFFSGLGFQVINLCVMFVFAIVSFLFFYEYQFAVDIVQG